MGNIPVSGSKIRSLRETTLRVSREKMAGLMGISTRQLANIEGKEVSKVQPDTFAALCQVLRVEPQSLKPSVEGDHQPSCQTFMAKLPTVNPRLVGRDRELDLLDQAWKNPNVRVVSLVAFGGVGKTALAVNWWQQHGAQGAKRVLGWSFYSQGSTEDRQISADFFFDHALRQWFGLADIPKHSWQRGERLAELVRAERTLLVLDGLEPLQTSPGGPAGRLKDQGMVALLRNLAASGSGLCVCTSRLPLVDLDDYEGRGWLAIDLDNLSVESGASYLEQLGVKGSPEQLMEASQSFGNHALALTLLGRLLVSRRRGDVRRRDTIPTLFSDPRLGGHARRIFRAYERLFDGKAELNVLRMMSLFDGPADSAAIRALRTLDEEDWAAALANLKEARLLEFDDIEGQLDCHPLLREHFAEEYYRSAPSEAKAAHLKLARHYEQSAPDRPETLEEMQPLFHAVFHHCKAGHYCPKRCEG